MIFPDSRPRVQATRPQGRDLAAAGRASDREARGPDRRRSWSCRLSPFPFGVGFELTRLVVTKLRQPLPGRAALSIDVFARFEVACGCRRNVADFDQHLPDHEVHELQRVRMGGAYWRSTRAFECSRPGRCRRKRLDPLSFEFAFGPSPVPAGPHWEKMGGGGLADAISGRALSESVLSESTMSMAVYALVASVATGYRPRQEGDQLRTLAKAVIR